MDLKIPARSRGIFLILRFILLLCVAGFAEISADAVLGFPQKLSLNGCDNVFRVTAKIYSGSSPAGLDAFRELKKLGITTIVSVDGLPPKVSEASAVGLRYFHLPLHYSDIEVREAYQLIRIAQAHPGPLYIHCHQGKHRGPAAVAILCRSIQHWSAEDAQAWMKKAGTSPDYKGLYRAALNFEPPSPEELESTPIQTAATVRPSDLIQRMLDIDDRWDRLQLFRNSGAVNTITFDEAGIDPAHEALLLLEDIRELKRCELEVEQEVAFAQLLHVTETRVEKLYNHMKASKSSTLPSGSANESSIWQGVTEACSQCHKKFRD